MMLVFDSDGDTDIYGSRKVAPRVRIASLYIGIIRTPACVNTETQLNFLKQLPA